MARPTDPQTVRYKRARDDLERALQRCDPGRALAAYAQLPEALRGRFTPRFAPTFHAEVDRAHGGLQWSLLQQLAAR